MTPTLPEEAVKAEEWRTIGEWPLYEVSDHGKVRGPKGELKAVKTWKGYLRVPLRNGTERKMVTIHSLVLTAFVGPRPDGAHGCHSNGDKEDNRISNLRWGTASENYDDKRRHGTDQCGERHGRHKLSENEVIEIRKAYRRGGRYWGVKSLARKFGVDPSTVERAAKGKSWASTQEGLNHG